MRIWLQLHSLALALGLAVVLVLTVLAMRLHGSGESQPPGPAYMVDDRAARQALDRVRPLCHLLAPVTRPLTLTARLWAMPHYDGRGKRYLVVEGLNAAGRVALRMGVDADTGHLLYANQAALPVAPADRPPLTERQAVQESAWWLRELGIAGRTHGWRLVCPPDRPYSRVWQVRWVGEGLAAHIRLDARTGRLYAAITSEYQTCSPSGRTRPPRLMRSAAGVREGGGLFPFWIP